VNVSAEESELVQLLTQLLRVVSPEGTGPGNRTAGNGHPGASRPDAGAPDAGAPDAGAPDAGGPDAGGPDSGGPDSGGTGQPAAPGLAAGPDEAAEPPLPVLSTSEARALIELVAARGIAQGQLGTLLGLEKSTVSRLAAGLERKGWIKRGRDETNQRYIRLYLTPEGSRVAAMVWRAWQSRQARILSGLSGREREGLAAGLRGLIRELAAERSAGDLPPG
jgi:DNA-binding MarR family transcriptional regulator